MGLPNSTIEAVDAAAKQAGVVTQMGNQGQASEATRLLCEMVWDDAIGPVREAHIWTNRPIWPQGMAEWPAAEPVPRVWLQDGCVRRGTTPRSRSGPSRAGCGT